MYISFHSIFCILKITSLLLPSFLILQMSSHAITEGGGSNVPFSVNIIPPSPEASALAKYADVPVSLYTGTPKITIPLYEINERDLKLPIYLSYHASAHKVEDEATRVGLGWTLNAGGVITRSIRGLPDEYGPGGFLRQASEMGNVGAYRLGTDKQREEWYDAMVRGCRDAEPDVFYYNFAGFTGKFQFDWDGKIVIASGGKLSIIPIGLNPDDNSFIQGWEVKTPNGIRFVFNAKATSLPRIKSPSLDIICHQLAFKKRPPLSWYLSEIFSPFTNSHIAFDYDSFVQVSERRAMETWIHNEALADPARNAMEMTIDTTGKYLKLISTSSGETTIEFKPGLERTDVKGSNLFTLGAVRVKNRNDTIVRNWDFNHDYSTGRLTLISARERIGSLAKPSYQFNYHSGVLPNTLSLARDHWGFPNNNRANTLIPATITERQGVPFELEGADRSPAPDNLNRAVIKKITYPTGGSDNFEFEPHEYSFEQNKRLKGKVTNQVAITVSTPGSNPLPGVEHAEIKSFTLSTLTDLNLGMHFFYGYKLGFGVGLFLPTVRIEKSNGQVILNFMPEAPAIRPASVPLNEKIFEVLPGQYKFIAKVKVPPTHDPNDPDDQFDPGRNSVTATLSWDDSTGEIITLRKKGGGVRIAKITSSYGFGNPEKVTKYIYTKQNNGEEISTGSLLESGYIYKKWMQYFETAGPTSNLIPKFVRFSQNRSALGTTQGSHVGYSQVTVVYGENGENGRSVYKYTSPIEITDFRHPGVPFPPAESREFARGFLKEQLDFPSNSDVPIRKISHEPNHISHVIKGLKVGWMLPGPKPPGPGSVHRYAAIEYNNILGYTRLKETKKFLNDAFGAHERKFTYEYDEESHKQLTKETTIDSEGKQLITLYKYPSDYPPGTSIALDRMVNSHMFDTIVERLICKEDDGIQLKALSALKNDYGLFGDKLRLAQVKSAKIGSTIFDPIPCRSVQNLYETRLIYHRYDDQGNILEHSQPNGMVTSYVWGENATLPVAQVENAKSNQIFYSSFENDIGASTSHAHTGKRSKQTNGKYKVPMESLPREAGDYLLSYWSKTGNKIWQKEEKIVMDYKPGNILETNVVNGFLDDVRLHPFDARMTTLTYEPLIGITSESDYNGLPTYYEYDELGRLTTVRDHKRNILEHVEYHFGGCTPASGKILAIEGIITFMRVHDVGTGFGPPCDVIDGEVIVRLDSEPDKAFGFTLRTDSDEEAHTGMFKMLRDSFRKERRVRIEYEVTGINNNQILRVAGLP